MNSSQKDAICCDQFIYIESNELFVNAELMAYRSLVKINGKIWTMKWGELSKMFSAKLHCGDE